MSTVDRGLRRTGRVGLAILLLALVGCQPAVTPDEARQVLAAIEQGEQPDDLSDVLGSPDAAAVVADEVVARMRAAAERALDGLPEELTSPARFSDPIVTEIRNDPVLKVIMDQSHQAGAAWVRALYVALLDQVPSLSPGDEDPPRPSHLRRAITDVMLWVLWNHDEVRSILVEREPDEPEQADFDAFRRLDYAGNVAIGVSNAVAGGLVPPSR